MALLHVDNLGRRHGRIELGLSFDKDYVAYKVYISNAGDVLGNYKFVKNSSAANHKSTKLPSMQRQYTPTLKGARRVILLSEAEAGTLPNSDFWVRVTGINAAGTETSLSSSPGKLITKISSDYPV